MEPLRHDPSLLAYVGDRAIAEEYDAYFLRNPLFACDERFVLNAVPAGSRVLDLGCGTGRHACQLARRGCRVTGVDLSAHMLRVARRKSAHLRGRVALVRADLLQLPFPEEPLFGAALLMFSILGMLAGGPARVRALREAAKRLRPGGVLLLHVHNEAFEHSPHRRLAARAAERLARLAGRLEPGDHLVRNYRGLPEMRLHSFRRAELLALLGEAGLRVRTLLGLSPRRERTLPPGLPGRVLERAANGFLVEAERPAS